MDCAVISGLACKSREDADDVPDAVFIDYSNVIRFKVTPRRTHPATDDKNAANELISNETMREML